MSKTYNNLKEFLDGRMRMTHIYQPVMLSHLLANGGQSNVSNIARAFLVHDPTQVEYYELITKRYPGQVLQRRGITERTKNNYSIPGFDELSEEEIKDLISICSNKLDEFLARKVSNPWEHRRKSSGYIPGSKKYEVLKNAKFRCLLCGISAGERALEVDHITPRSQGGTDDISNLQALCFSCNAMKKDTDDTDFRNVEEEYETRKAGCPQCFPHSGLVRKEEELAYSTHVAVAGQENVLIVPKRHIGNYFGLYQPELNTIQRILYATQAESQQSDESIIGFEVSFEAGVSSAKPAEHAYLKVRIKRNC